jgi:hypothetical protein
VFNFRAITLAATLAVCAAALTISPIASAKGGNPVRAAGKCSKSSTAKIKLSREDRGVEVEFEVDQNRNGIPWKVTLRRNGSIVASLTKITRAPSGSFTVRRIIAGSGKFVAVATRASGERCTATASI